MNYLAHSLISLEIDEKIDKNKNTLYGNFAGDYYKGTIDSINLPNNLKEGVVLHRIIDSVSDRSENFLNEILGKELGIFKGIASDIIIDHFISKNFYMLFNEKISDIEKKILYTIDSNKKYFPSNFKNTFNCIANENVLVKYGEIEFINKVFCGMSNRIRRGEKLLLAIEVLEKNYFILQDMSIKEFNYTKENSIVRFLKTI